MNAESAIDYLVERVEGRQSVSSATLDLVAEELAELRAAKADLAEIKRTGGTVDGLRQALICKQELNDAELVLLTKQRDELWAERDTLKDEVVQNQRALERALCQSEDSEGDRDTLRANANKVTCPYCDGRGGFHASHFEECSDPCYACGAKGHMTAEDVREISDAVTTRIAERDQAQAAAVELKADAEKWRRVHPDLSLLAGVSEEAAIVMAGMHVELSDSILKACLRARLVLDE